MFHATVSTEVSNLSGLGSIHSDITKDLLPRQPAGNLSLRFGVRTAPPLPGLMSDWRNDLALVKNLANSVRANVVIAGDFNATMRHGDLGAITSHADAVSTIRGVTRGTWPLNAPQFLRSSIDHVSVPQESYAVSTTKIVDIPGSDHAAVATSLSTNG